MRLLVLLMLLLVPSPVQARWLEASSEHFVVYADDSEQNIRRFSDQLERYHAAMAFVTASSLPAPSPSNRVTVYVVSNEQQVRKLHGGGDRYLWGFYVPRAGGSLAIVPRVRASIGEVDMSMITLLHEYAHHYIISTSTFPMPRWLSEGAAEFFASASFTKQGGVGVGRPAQHRAGELLLPHYASDVSAEELLDPDTYEGRSGRRYDAFYGKSWLLYHYLIFDPNRQGQLKLYSQGLVAGKSSRETALAAFGEFKDLDRDLKTYLNKRRMLFLDIKPELLRIGLVKVRALSEGAAAMMPVVIRSRRGVTEEEAAELVVEARAIAAKYPGDAAVLAALAEAEFDSGNHEAAVKAADAALAIDPSLVNAYVQKGLALFGLAADAKDTDAAYIKARAVFLDLNQRENDHPLPLIYFYRSFAEMGNDPTANAKAGLERAAELAPFDLGLRMEVAQMQMRDGRYKAARFNLAPIAYNPHGGGAADAAKALLASIEGRGDSPELAGGKAAQ